MDTKADQGTDVRRFLLTRGQLILKEFRPIGKFNCSYGQHIAATILSISMGNSNSSNTVYGLKLEEVSSDDKVNGSNFLDASELPELAEAIKYIEDAAATIRNQPRDYTEAVYVSRDGVKIGFYQNTDSKQQAFIDVDGDGEMVFMPVGHLEGIVDLISKAIQFIENKRAIR